MTIVIPGCPEPPEWRVDWNAVDAACPWLCSLVGCLQDPIYHAEGDVLTHTRLVVDELAALASFRVRNDEERQILFAAALLHDIGKRGGTRDVTGRISSPGRARRGAIEARAWLWRQAVPFATREQVVSLIRFHMRPFVLIDDEHSQRLAIETSQVARADLLSILAEADARGRRCSDQSALLFNVGLFEEYCRELGCLTGPYPFPSSHARFHYFRSLDRNPDDDAFDDTIGEVIVLSGLPGVGKDCWIEANASDRPVVSLDAIRKRLGISPTDSQGAAVRQAREEARALLRGGRRFVWNATNLSRAMRAECIDLITDYHARARIVYVEVGAERQRVQNRERPDPVPEHVVEQLLTRWEVPDLTEAHAVAYVVQSD